MSERWVQITLTLIVAIIIPLFVDYFNIKVQVSILQQQVQVLSATQGEMSELVKSHILDSHGIR